MSEDVERKLDGFYRCFDAAARRLEARWKGRPGRSLLPAGAWILAGTAAAALLLVALLPRGGGEVRRAAPPSVAKPAEETPPRTPSVRAPKPPEAPRPVIAPQEPPGEKVPTPQPPPEEPSPIPEPRPEPAPPKPGPPAPRPTVAGRAETVLPETDGPFELSDRPVRGRQKDLRVASGDTLRAAGVVKLSFAPQSFVLAAPQTVLAFRPGGKGLALELEQGKLLLELVEGGPEVRVVTRAAEVLPLGTVFAVQVENNRTTVLVEEGRVEVKSARGNAAVRAGQALQAAEDGALGEAVPADLRALSWARAHRPPERALFSEDFTAAGRWEAEVRDGAARGVSGQIHLASDRPPLFEVPVRGRVTLVYRADRVGNLYVQFFAADLRVNFRREVPVLRSPQWKTLVLDLDEFAPFDRSKHPGRLPPGTAVTDLVIAFETDLEKGSLWVDSFRVTGLR